MILQDDDTFLKLSHASRLLGVSSTTLSSAITEGDLRAVKLTPKCIRIRKRDLEAWLTNCEAGRINQPVG